MTLRGGTLRLTVLLAVALLGWRVELASQVAPRSLGRPWVLGPNGEPQDPKAGRERASRFQLYSDRDFARVFMTPGATLSGSSLFLCWENWPNNFGCPDGSYQRVRSDNLFTFAFLYGTHIYGVPATEWLEHRRMVPSLANARGRGYSVFNNTSASHFINPKDGLVGVLHSGVTAEPDGTCRQTHGLFLGDPLMPLSN
ncbi:MAG: hypothetical protein HY701_00005, partial [Gemmatimonadetes bacterium]|nr:hypothetical protein [Gemmatimonadota bacterium]